MNISASLSSTFADLGSPTPVAPDSATPATAAISASSSLVMNVADEAVEEDTSALGSVNAWA